MAQLSTLDRSTLHHMEALEYAVNDLWIGDRNIFDLAIGLAKSMRTIWKTHTLDTLMSLLLLCSRAMADSIPAQLPADVTMNKGAGRGSWLIVALRLESGEELPFVVDTGSPITLLDKSLEPKLGKRLETMGFSTPDRGEQESGVYPAPKLYLGGVLLATDRYTATYPFKQLSTLSHQHIMGVLGMDCLRHYCVQLDFQARRMRFLAPDHVNTAEVGKAFALMFSNRGQNFPPMFSGSGQNDSLPFIQHAGLLGGTSTNSQIDTGNNVDGAVEKGVIKGHYLTRFAHFLFKHRAVRLPQCVWDGETYTKPKLRVETGRNANRLGLRFLARHLVTFDFPEQTMYLKQTSIGPLSFEEER